MSTETKLDIVLCWHMHQPDYRDPFSRRFHAPWTWLHAIKDYTDMAFHLEHHAQARAVVNFSPVLLDQLADLAGRIERFLDTGAPIGDILLDALGQPVLAEDDAQRRALAEACTTAHERNLVDRHEPFRLLVHMARSTLAEPGGFFYLEDRFLFDLLAWYHLAWMGESLKRTDDRVARLIGKKHQYGYTDRRELLALIGELVRKLPERYRALAEDGRVELSTSPWTHPILPLLLDFSTACEALPDCVLPAAATYPGGEARARWQLDEARNLFRTVFGHDAAGCWPSEGAVCSRSLALIARAGFRWTASGQRVLRNSLGRTHPDSNALHRVYRVNGGAPDIFFRDDVLSDLIGFTYKDWHGDHAAADLVRHLEGIAAEPAAPGRVVTILLDGENAWEHYPNNAYYFLTGLYQQLSAHPRLRMTTFTDHLERLSSPVPVLERLVAGSWVHGDLATWIGHPDKNHAWQMLVAAKRCFDHCANADEHVRRQLAVCEGSDWFWWPGEYNPAEAVARFERLYRLQLAGLYRLMCETPPEELSHPFTRGSGHPETGGTMRPST